MPILAEHTLTLFGVLGCAVFLIVFISTKNQLNEYIRNDFSKQEGWTGDKRQALLEGISKGHDLERLSDHLNQSKASVRAKLVKMKVYDQYLEHQVDIGEANFNEWKKLRRKIGKLTPIEGEKSSEGSEETSSPDWKLIQSLTENWFDPRLEFCETFYASRDSKLPDPCTQHEVVKHVAAFLNTAGGQVLIGFGKKRKLLGLFDDDLRTTHHYQNRIREALRKALGEAALPFVNVSMIRWGSEDVCLVSCERAAHQVACVHQKYNDIAGYEKRQSLVYRRIDARSVYDELSAPE